MEFEIFKSNICHDVKRMGDINFLIYILQSSKINDYFEKKMYFESFYLLAMVDYLSRINNVPIAVEYDYIRKYKLDTIIYPSSILAKSFIFKNNKPKEKSIKECIPEFFQYNIIENEIRNVC